MKRTNRQLALSFLITVPAIVGSVILAGNMQELPIQHVNIGLAYLAWPIALGALITLAVDLLFWSSGVQRIRTVLNVPEKFKPRVTLFLQTVRNSTITAAWSMLLAGALVVLAQFGSQQTVYYNLMGVSGIVLASRVSRMGYAVPFAIWAAFVWSGLAGLAQALTEPQPYVYLLVGTGVVLVSMVTVKCVSNWRPGVGLVLGFPQFRLLAVAVTALLMFQGWSEKYGFLGSPLLAGISAAMSVSYFAHVVRELSELARPRWQLVADCLGLTAALGWAVGGTLAIWALLGALPNVSTAFLGEWPAHGIGRETLAHFSYVFDARHLIAGFTLALMFAARIPGFVKGDGGYVRLIKAAAYGIAGALAWVVAVSLTPLGHGYPLLGAAIGCGLFAAALGSVARSIFAGSGGVLNTVADWFSKSVLRTFFVGASLALYGLLVRPVLYDVLSLAPLYEWIVVLVIASFAFYRMRTRAQEELMPNTAPPASWTRWSRHTPDTAERNDPRMAALLATNQHFVTTGEWSHVWRYVLELLLRNRVPLESIPNVFEPMRRYHPEGATAGRLRRKNRRAIEGRREQALVETLDTAEEALSLSKEPLETVDEDKLLASARPFLDDGVGAERIAVLLVAAYWQRGASVDAAAALWFPLVIMERDAAPPSLKMATFIDKLSGRAGRRNVEWNRARRAGMIEGALAHLFHEGGCEGLAAGLVVPDTRGLSGGRREQREHRLPQNLGVELIPSADSEIFVRPGEGAHGFTTELGVNRQPILPKDFGSVELIEGGP